MKIDKYTWLAVVLVLMGAAGAYRWRSDHQPASHSKTTVHNVEKKAQPSASTVPRPERSVETKDYVGNQPQKRGDEESMQVIREALVKAKNDILKERMEASQGQAQGSAGLPLEMSFEQYRVWAKMAGALADRDYQAAEAMIPSIESLFGPTMVEAMLDAAVEDYAAYLASVTQARCEGWDAESVWRKTMFMSFALARLNRSSAALESGAKYARELCGYSA